MWVTLVREYPIKLLVKRGMEPKGPPVIGTVPVVFVRMYVRFMETRPVVIQMTAVLGIQPILKVWVTPAK